MRYARGMKRGVLAGALAVVVIGAAASGGWWYTHQKGPCSFPKSLEKEAENLQLYCMDERKLPKGVISNTKTADYGEGAVVFTLKDGKNTLNVSLQQKPKGDMLSKFIVGVIPLNFDVQTPVGKAKTGVYQGQSITSLEAGQKTWVLITGPGDYSPDRLTVLLKLFSRN